MKSKPPLVVVVGTGAAGLAAAITAASNGAPVTLLTRSYYTNDYYRWGSSGGCTWKTHAFNAAVAGDDTVEAHYQDTLKGGAGANNPALARILCEGSVQLIPWLESLGLEFDRDADGHLETRPFGGCGSARAVFLKDMLGFHITKVLRMELQRLVDLGRVCVFSGIRATELLKDSHGRIRAIKAVVTETMELIEVPCRTVVLADGGGASMYSPSAASCDKTCDGLVLGLKAGAEAIDMEFVQFHPTGLISPVSALSGSLVEEAVRFDGAELRNRHGHRFMFDYHQRGEQATRDEVSRGIFREIVAGRGHPDNSVSLDVSTCRKVFAEKYPALHERLRQADFDTDTCTELRVAPTGHFLMGGLRIDVHGRTTVPGLLAAGESAGGVHGANRLGGNGLSEALVFGKIAGRQAALDSFDARSCASEMCVVGHMTERSGTLCAEDLLEQLRNVMYWKAGPVRDATGLNDALSYINDISGQVKECGVGTGSRAASRVQTLMDLRNLLMASRLIVGAAIDRTESRGAHHRADYPAADPDYSARVFRIKDSGDLARTAIKYAPAEEPTV